jgi:outer membrane lipoprotein LolB
MAFANPGIFRWLWTVALASFLAGCVPALRQGPVDPAAQANLARLERWSLEGRIGVVTENDAFQANLHWEHENSQDRLILVNDGGQTPEISRDPDGYLQERLGFPAPVQALRYWLLGLPQPDRESEPVYDERGLLQWLRQGGWQLEYRAFVAEGARNLPQKLFVEGRGVKMKVFVDRWDIPG